jgi:putative endonuclease
MAASTRSKGAHYESLARKYLEGAGLEYIAANIQCKYGELDLIMRDQDIWVFVEVRYRNSAKFGNAQSSITRQKQQRLLRTAAWWLAQHQASFATTDCRFDIFAITDTQQEWLPDAFNAEALSGWQS